MSMVILKVLIKLLNLSMEMCLKQEVMKCQNLNSLKKKLKLKILTNHSLGSDVQIFTPICSALTNFLSNYAPQFLFRLITVYVIFRVFSYIFNKLCKESVHFHLE